MEEEYRKRVKELKLRIKIKLAKYEDDPMSHFDYLYYSRQFREESGGSGQRWDYYWQNIIEDKFHNELSDWKRQIWKEDYVTIIYFEMKVMQYLLSRISHWYIQRTFLIWTTNIKKC